MKLSWSHLETIEWRKRGEKEREERKKEKGGKEFEKDKEEKKNLFVFSQTRRIRISCQAAPSKAHKSKFFEHGPLVFLLNNHKNKIFFEEACFFEKNAEKMNLFSFY